MTQADRAAVKRAQRAWWLSKLALYSWLTPVLHWALKSVSQIERECALTGRQTRLWRRIRN